MSGTRKREANAHSCPRHAADRMLTGEAFDSESEDRDERRWRFGRDRNQPCGENGARANRREDRREREKNGGGIRNRGRSRRGRPRRAAYGSVPAVTVGRVGAAVVIRAAVAARRRAGIVAGELRGAAIATMRGAFVSERKHGDHEQTAERAMQGSDRAWAEDHEEIIGRTGSRVKRVLEHRPALVRRATRPLHA